LTLDRVVLNAASPSPTRAPKPCLALGLSSRALPLLQRLQQAGEVHWIALTPQASASLPSPPADLLIGAAADLLANHWDRCGGLILIGAVGAATRLVAPLLSDKETDPAVLVLDAEGGQVIPLLGSHRAGAEVWAHGLAAALNGKAVITGDSAIHDRLALDGFGEAWGWQRSGSGSRWSALMIERAQNRSSRVLQTAGSPLWRQAPGAQHTCCATDDALEADLTIGPEHRRDDGCAWHPACLWLGVGCERDTSLSLISRAIERSLEAAGLAIEAVAGLSSIDRKGDEPALIALAQQRGWPLRLHRAEALAAVAVPTPSNVVKAEMGTASVAEAAALLAAGEQSHLRQTKTIEKPQSSQERGAATVAIAQASLPQAPQRGQLHLIGSGPGDLNLLTPEARRALAQSSVWVGYGLYLDLLEPLRRCDQVRLDGQLTRERERCAQALDLARQGVRVALVSSGDSGIYGMAGLALELWLALPECERPAFAVHPGISALQLAAARVGAPLMHDFCTISLSDRLTPWPVIERRLEAAAKGDFVVALYNPRSRDRDWQLARARDLLLAERSATTPVLLARQLGRPEESLHHTTLGALNPDDVDMLTVLLVGNSSTYVASDRMVTPRGYPGAALS